MKFKKYLALMLCAFSIAVLAGCGNNTPAATKTISEELESAQDSSKISDMLNDVSANEIVEDSSIGEALAPVYDYGFLDEVHEQLNEVSEGYTYDDICDMVKTDNTQISGYVEALDMAVMLEHSGNNFSIQFDKSDGSEYTEMFGDVYQYLAYNIDGEYYQCVYNGGDSEFYQGTLSDDFVASVIKSLSVIDTDMIYSIETLGEVNLDSKMFTTVKIGSVCGIVDVGVPELTYTTLYIKDGAIYYYECEVNAGDIITNVYLGVKDLKAIAFPTMFEKAAEDGVVLESLDRPVEEDIDNALAVLSLVNR